MEDKYGIEIRCRNCGSYVCNRRNDDCEGCCGDEVFIPSEQSLKKRIEELSNENYRLSRVIMDLSTGTLDKKNRINNLRAAKALCIAAGKLNYDIKGLTVFQLIDKFLEEDVDKSKS